MEETTLMIEFPVKYIQEEGYHLIVTDDETKKFMDIPIVIQADTKEEVIEKFWKMMQCHLSYSERIRRRHDRWALFYKGQWGHIGSNWFSVLGFHFYFRHGKNMKGGFYFPFTKLNLTIRNYWRKKYSYKKF